METKNPTFILIAASDSTASVREDADFVCTGVHDEITIQNAIDCACRENRNLLLANGTYRIDGFRKFGDDGPPAALCFPNNRREYIFRGQNAAYGGADGVQFYVTPEALASIEDREYDEIGRAHV